jgi:hypothetical protein
MSAFGQKRTVAFGGTLARVAGICVKRAAANIRSPQKINLGKLFWY